MQTFKNKPTIKNIIIDHDYSLSGNSLSISKNESGLNVNISVLNKIRNISNMNSILDVLSYFPFLEKDLKLNSIKNIPVSKILGSIRSKEYINYLQSEIENTVAYLTNYHTNIYTKRINTYLNLHSVKLGDTILERPDYNHYGITGRTSILNGYNFLTLKKEERKNLRSTYENEFLVEIDFKSCEPFFYALSQGLEVSSSDVYQWLKDDLSITIEREKFKRAVLSIIYGAKDNTVKSVSGLNQNDIKKIKEKLNIEKFSQSLEKEFSDNGFILNYYGRPILSNNNLVNYWIQSSAVDFCSLTFGDFIDKKKIKPCFFVHDSMTFSISEKDFKEIKDIAYLIDPISNIKIPVKIQKLLDN